jgi:hypothetical protein
MLSTVNAWGCLQYFFMLPCHSNHQFLLFSQPHEDGLTPSPLTNKMQHYAMTTMHWYTLQTDEAIFPDKGFLPIA